MTEKGAKGLILKPEGVLALKEVFADLKRLAKEAEKYDIDHTGMVQWRLEQIQATIVKIEDAILN